MASRCEMVETILLPAIADGKTIISDRFLLANVVYQSVFLVKQCLEATEYPFFGKVLYKGQRGVSGIFTKARAVERRTDFNVSPLRSHNRRQPASQKNKSVHLAVEGVARLNDILCSIGVLRCVRLS